MRVETGRLRVVAGNEAGRQTATETETTRGAPSPGRYLREQRQRRGMSLDQVAASTKIPRPSLELLEDDRGHDLPGPVFVKGFLRCYAKALGVQPEVVLELLYERERVALQARRRERPTEPHRIAPPVHPGSFEQFRRPRRTSGASNAAWQKLLPTLPSTQILLWIAVAVLVAVVLLAAFNLAGSSPGVAAQS